MTKLLKDFTSSARSILLEMNQLYSLYKVNNHMRQQNPGQTASIIKKMRKTATTSPNKATGQENRSTFPRNSIVPFLTMFIKSSRNGMQLPLSIPNWKLILLPFSRIGSITPPSHPPERAVTIKLGIGTITRRI